MNFVLPKTKIDELTCVCGAPMRLERMNPQVQQFPTPALLLWVCNCGRKAVPGLEHLRVTGTHP